MDHIFYPKYYATLEDGTSMTSDTLMDLTAWAHVNSTGLLMVRRYEADGSIRLQPNFVYEAQEGRLVRIW